MCAAQKNKLFAKYGHDCEITSSWEDLPMFQSSGNILSQIKKVLIRCRMASELNVRGNRFLQSQKILEAQHRLQMKHLHIIHPFSVARWHCFIWKAWMVIVLTTVFVAIPLELPSFKFPVLQIISLLAWMVIVLATVFVAIPLELASFKFPVLQIISLLGFVHSFNRKWWEAWMVIILATVFVAIPLDLASFKCHLKPHLNDFKTWKYFRLILDLICCCDVLMNFFTGYCDHKKREVVLQPKKIFMRYFFTYFIFDLLSSIPTHMDLVVPSIYNNSLALEFLQFAGLGKALRFISFQIYSRRLAEAFNVDYAIYKVLQTMFCYMLYTHVITCINMIIFGAYINIEDYKDDMYLNDTFFSFKNKDNTPLDAGTAYLGTLYRTIHLVTTSADGIIVLNTALEVYVTVVWFMSRVMFFYLISQLLDVVASTGSSTHKYREMVRQLREYMRHKQLPEMLQRRLIGYYEFRFQKSYFRESEILDAISGQLRQEIVMHSCRKLVENVEFFKNLPLPLIIRIVSSLITDIYLVNDVIIKANTVGNSMYFIASGCVAIYTKHGTEICHLEDGDYFGEIALVKEDNMREASVVAVEMCELYRLDRKEFTRAILPYPDLMEKIKKIAFFRQERTQYIDERAQRDVHRH